MLLNHDSFLIFGGSSRSLCDSVFCSLLLLLRLRQAVQEQDLIVFHMEVQPLVLFGVFIHEDKIHLTRPLLCFNKGFWPVLRQCKVRDMLCHAHVSEPMNRKVYWDLGFVKFHVLRDTVKYGVWRIKLVLVGFGP